MTIMDIYSKLGNSYNMKTVLVADDNDFIRGLIRHALKKEGFGVIEADDGDTAVEALHHHPEIESVVLDLKMPKMSGKKAYSLIRSSRPDLKCIVCSGNINDEEKEELSLMGIKTFLIKPFPFEDLFKAIDDH